MAASNRQNPNKVRYYHDLADTIGIFWQFHKERIRSGNIEGFAMEIIPGTEVLAPFSLQRRIQPFESSSRPYAHKIIWDFATSVRNTMNGSWQQFIGKLGLPTIPHILNGIPISESEQKFFTDYTRGLAVRANEEAQLYGHAHLTANVTLGEIGYAGLHTGSKATVQLASIFGDELNPSSATRISKVDQDNIMTAMKGIGIPVFEPQGEYTGDYSLLDNSAIGLNSRTLRVLGLGFAIGCPASMKISPKAESFLIKDIGIRILPATMLDDFASIMPEQFDRYVRDWYYNLTPEQGSKYVDPEQRRILNGEIRRTLRERGS